MSDVESFFGADDRGESMDPAAFERFKERMAAASAQLKAIAAQEQKQKKKEDELIKILLKFIKTGQKRDIMLLVLRLLEQNVPAVFIVSILLISNIEIQRELGVKFLSAPAPEGAQNGHTEPARTGQGENLQYVDSASPIQNEQNFSSTVYKSLAGKGEAADSQNNILPGYYFQSAVLPLKIKIAIDAWTREIIQRSQEYANRVLATVLDADGLIKLPAAQLVIFCLRDYLYQQAIQIDYDVLKNFVNLMLGGIIKKIKEDFDNRKKLE